jgi:hypothetical protein
MYKYLVFMLSAFLFYSCENINGSGHIKTERRNVGSFDGVQASGSMDIEVTNGENASVEIEADDNILPYIVTDVGGGMLDIYFKPHFSFTNVHTKIFVTAPNLSRLFVRGSGNINGRNTIHNDRSISTSISGSGDIHADVDAPEVSAEIAGSGNLSLQGRCKNFRGSISGSGDLKCSDLLSENTEVSIFGSGNAHVYSSVRLKASTTGSGDIFYRGNPSSPEISRTGSGSVTAEK